ncbi:MAG: biosynthetic peptidoglycan transglycosylase [Acidaminobacteraceae bacterium]
MFKIIKKLFHIALFIVFVLVSIILYKGYVMYEFAINSCNIEEKVEIIKSKDYYVPIDEVSDDFLIALISVEDRRFYEHLGVDRISTGRAIMTNIIERRFAEGGSTITQQLAKNLYFDRAKKIERKVAELFVVFQLERKYTKDEILEMYINIIYYGDGFTGIGNASEGYFGVHPSKLSRLDSILLAGLPQSPSYYALSKNPEGAKLRMDSVIDAMAENSLITKLEFEELLKEVETYEVKIIE